MRTFAISLIIFTTAAPIVACLWDRDTFAMEARGRLEVVETAVGWFDRFPPEYYRMRLDRVTPEIAADPKRLDLYDDAAVACDRLGRHAEAVGWMEKKGAAMQALPPAEAQDHRYRMLANLGVFHTHLWLKNADREIPSPLLDRAIQDVEAALQINPNAHFGRERAHLALLLWWKAGVKALVQDHAMPEAGLGAAHSFDELAGDDLKTDFVKGFCGLIQMGSAQDSVDVHALLAMKLGFGRPASESHHSLAYLVCLRLGELALDQRTAVHPLLMHETKWKQFVAGLPTGAADRTSSVEDIGKTLLRYASHFEGSQDPSIIARYFHEARSAAVRRQADKTAFMLAQFKEGRHPDTHPDFWSGWQEPALPPIPPQSKEEKIAGLWLGGWLTRHRTELVQGIVILVVLFGFTATLAMIRMRKQRLTKAG